jgi:Domain of unknown function (DUF397).
MGGADLNGLAWKKSAKSGPTGGNCVEVAALPSGVAVRDSKNPSGPVLLFSPDVWRSFLVSLRREEMTL